MSNKIDVGISATDAGFTSTIKKVNDSTKTLDDSVKKVASNVTASFGSMVKAGAALAVGFGAVKLAGAAFREVFEGFGEALNLGGELNDLASRTGETAGNILVLQRAFDNAGSSAEKVGPSINKMQKFLDDAAQGAAKNTEVLGRLGVSMVELQGKTPTEQMQLLAERISAIKDPTERGALAMAVFGKSGGELLPLLRNFSGELQTAQSQLGSMPGVIDRSNAAFDTISDNLAVIRTKFRDLAAGLLDRLAPALEFATTMLTRFDAAALGMKIGDILIGAGEGMRGFKAALEAISLGDFSLAWDIAFTSIKLTAAESLNSIVANVKGLFAAVKTMISESGITIAIEALTMGVVNKISSGLRSVIAEFLSSIGKVEAAKEMMLLSKADEDRAQNYFTTAKAGFSSLGDNIADAMEPMRKAYDDAVKSSGELIDTQKISAELAEKNAQLAEKIAEAKKQESITTQEIKKQVDYTVTRQDIIKAIAENIADYEEAILQAKKDGNKEREVELGKQKAYAEELKRSLELGLSMDDAIKNAKKAQADYVKSITGELKEQTAEMAKQLSLSDELQKRLDDAVKKEQIDPGGRTENKINEAMAAGDFTKSQREINKLFQQETKAAAKELFGEYKKMEKFKEQEKWDVDFKEAQREAEKEEKRARKMSAQDMAKELGIDASDKNRFELNNAIKEELERRKQEKDDPTKKGEKEEQKADKNEQQQNKLQELVSAIKTAVERIEPKLPQTALGY